MPLVGLISSPGSSVGSWLLVHFSWQAIFATLLPLPWC